jgi:hypothetical protein
MRLRTALTATALGAAILPGHATADLLAPGETVRVLPFSVLDDRPFLAVRIGDTPGRMMFDNGTPEALFLNRDALALPEGTEVGRGFAASGQAITVQVHPAPAASIDGRAVPLPDRVTSGDFGFTQALYGADFLGFIGTPMVDDGAFLLDYARQTLTVLRTDADGTLAVPPPPDSAILATIAFAIWPGEQPTTAARLGDGAILVDVDTGDTNTLYIRPATRAALETAGLLVAGDAGHVLTGLVLAGYAVPPQRVDLVEAGGPADLRPTGSPDFLRLGSRFLAGQPTLWNFPARTLHILSPDTDWTP